MKDSQVKQVYKWEKEWPTWNRPILTNDECRNIIQYACDLYDVPAPKLLFPRQLLGYSYYDPNDHTLLLRKRHRNIAVCLHEAAHAVHGYVCGDNHEIHGPEWLTIYLWLLIHSGIASRTALLESASAYEVTYLDVPSHGPRRLRSTYRALWRAAERARGASAASA